MCGYHVPQSTEICRRNRRIYTPWSPGARIAPETSTSIASELTQDRCQSERYASHALVVERVGRVARPMVMAVAVVGGVGDHHRGEALVAERGVVGAHDAGHEGGSGDAFRGELRMFSKKRNR